MEPRVLDPGWVGRCSRCSYLLVLQEAETDEAGALINWPCYALLNQCLGTYHTLPNQQALLAAYVLGGLDAVRVMLKRAS